jgi:regulator of sigma E protease
LYTIRAIPIGGFVMMGQVEAERDIIKEGTEIGLTLDPAGSVSKIHVKPDEGMVSGTLDCNTLDISGDLQVAILVAGERKVFPVLEDAVYVDSKADRMQQIVTKNRRLDDKPKLQRLVIMAAGALMNFALAWVILLGIGLFVGEPVGTTTELAGVNADAPADLAGLVAGDIILEINDHVLHDGDDIIAAIQSAGDNPVSVVYERDGEQFETIITPINQAGNYVIGISITSLMERSFAGGFRYANAAWRSGFMLIFDTLRMLATGEVGANQLAGPVGVAQMTTQVSMMGLIPLLSFASLININLGIFNLLPFPALDGGHITFIAIEAIIGRPVSPKIQNGIAMVGFIALMGLMLFTTFHDVLRIFD